MQPFNTKRNGFLSKFSEHSRKNIDYVAIFTQLSNILKLTIVSPINE